jgi:hypothetical protein
MSLGTAVVARDGIAAGVLSSRDPVARADLAPFECFISTCAAANVVATACVIVRFGEVIEDYDHAVLLSPALNLLP